ncbi:hypothetical protein BJY17_001937 [Agromyces hippuratus]|uniref:Uncharacterized protein n=1 Tax=Agromyces hippuratus TaxID=286438 RepID=A0A852WY63_9MICO|nr:hypothetical protein [Agromyces hippuratus]NYG21190.1 hypothetical protein [Agromyces hippuratus]
MVVAQEVLAQLLAVTDPSAPRSLYARTATEERAFAMDLTAAPSGATDCVAQELKVIIEPVRLLALNTQCAPVAHPPMERADGEFGSAIVSTTSPLPQDTSLAAV